VASDPGSGSGWPSVGREPRPWSARPAPGTAFRAQTARHTGTYLAAVVPAIAGATLVLPSELSAEVADAGAEVARFDAEIGAEMAPFAAVLLRSEAAASSQIEGLTASARAIAEAEAGAGSRRNAALVVANTRAMTEAIALEDRLDAGALLTVHRTLLEATDPRHAGRWREEQVWIGGSGLGPHRADFVPPHHSSVEAGVTDLLVFAARTDVPVLAQAAVAHAQFETIHPFTDGNGRTGRALLRVLLRAGDLTRAVTVPVSAGLLTDTVGYFAALTSYRAGHPAAIVRRVVESSFSAVANGRHLVTDLRAVRTGWDARIRARRGSNVWRAADLVLRSPVVDAARVATELGTAPTNVYRSIEPLVAAGVLVPRGDRRRNRVWRCPEVLTALDDFAVRSGRRRLPDDD